MAHRFDPPSKTPGATIIPLSLHMLDDFRQDPQSSSVVKTFIPQKLDAAFLDVIDSFPTSESFCTTLKPRCEEIDGDREAFVGGLEARAIFHIKALRAVASVRCR